MNSAGWGWFPEWWLHNLETLSIQLAESSFDPWLLFRYAMQALLSSLPVFLADYVCGLAILKLLKVRLAGQIRHACALALGLATAASGIFIFGSIGRITYKGLIAFTVLQIAFGIWFARADLKLPSWRWSYLWLLPALLVFLPDLMMPIVEYDSTMYHMASARWYMEQHKTTYHEGIRFNAQPHMPVMLYMRQWWLMSDANLVKLVNLEYLAILAGLFAWAARRYRVRWGMLAAFALVFGSPIFGYIARQEYADLALTTWLGAGVCVLVSQGARLNRNRLLLAGLLLGAAGASKLQGLLVAACFILADLIVDLVRKRNMRRTLERSIWLGVPVVVVGLPWWFRGWRYTGSPFFPFFTDSPDVKALFLVNANYGVGRDLLTLLATPWNMIVVPPERYADLFRFGPSCLILLTIGLLALVVRRRKPIDATTYVITLGSILFTLFWFRSGQVMRYEACLLPLWTLLLLSALSRLKWHGPTIALLFVPLLLASTALTSNVIRYAAAPPVTWPATQALLNSVLPYYRATQAASHVIQKNDLVYTWFCDDIRAYSPGKSYGDWFGGYTYTWLGNVHTGTKITDPAKLLERLKSTGFRYVIIDRTRAANGGTIYGSKFIQSGLVQRGVAVPNTQTIFDDGRYAVFRLL